ncbi:MAG: polyprenyl diphosphate synthase [Bacteroidales bacterium]|jgi:undecaprenyl diphosphate synthase|nr:polyprenyl diphosphate synthase [Bacteroidales bacterium]
MTNELKIPVHVTIIMDGNGRWAKKQGLKRIFGHRAGVESVRQATEFAAEKGVKFLSLFAFSEENWSRPQDEISLLMELMVDAILKETPKLVKNNVKFRVIGDKSKLPQNVQEKIASAEATTEASTGLTLIVFMSYSGKWDILQAAHKYFKESGVKDSLPSPDIFDKYLATAGIPDPDLLIRTSGEQRISNYMLWQTAYTEFYFPDVLWPDFRKNDFQLALEEYSARERRYGKTGEQVNNL